MPKPSIEEQQRRSFESMRSAAIMAIQRYLDTTAQTRGYDGILSLCSYANSTDPVFAAEANAGVVLRDSCWRKGYLIMAEVAGGTRPMPTITQVLAEMPGIVWPLAFLENNCRSS